MTTAIDWCRERLGSYEMLEWINNLGPDATMADAWLACHRGDWMLWALSRCEHVEDYREAITEITNTIADRAVRTALSAIEGIDEAWAKKWRTWANDWLSGEDKSKTTFDADADFDFDFDFGVEAATLAARSASYAVCFSSYAAATDALKAIEAAVCSIAGAAAHADELRYQAEDIRHFIPEWPGQ